MHRLALLLPQAWWPTAAIVVLLLVLQAVVLFYLSWRDPRVKEQVPATTAKATKDNGTCQLPCQSNMKVASGGCCDDVWLPYVAFTNLKYLPQVGACKWGGGLLGTSSTQPSAFLWMQQCHLADAGHSKVLQPCHQEHQQK